MDRRTPPPAPADPACTECAQLTAESQRAYDEGNHSASVDYRVLLRRHQAEAHGVDAHGADW